MCEGRATSRKSPTCMYNQMEPKLTLYSGSRFLLRQFGVFQGFLSFVFGSLQFLGHMGNAWELVSGCVLRIVQEFAKYRGIQIFRIYFHISRSTDLAWYLHPKWKPTVMASRRKRISQLRRILLSALANHLQDSRLRCGNKQFALSYSSYGLIRHVL